MINNFIDVYENVLSVDQCNQVIEDFNRLSDQGFASNHMNEDRSQINDNRIGYSQMLLSLFKDEDRGDIIHTVGNTLNEYTQKYQEGMFSPETETLTVVEGILVQKTRPTEGYHVWHAERQDVPSSTRAFSWILYLNDVEEGGETEFLYYSKRVKPKTGSLLVFPAGYTHCHRGNPPLTGDKFIMTGWNRYRF